MCRKQVVVRAQVARIAGRSARAPRGIARPLESGARAVVEVREVAVDVLAARVALAPRAHANAILLVELKWLIVAGDVQLVRVRLDVVPARPERRPGRDR